MYNNNLILPDNNTIENINTTTLSVVIDLLPIPLVKEEYKKLIKNIIYIILKDFLEDKNEELTEIYSPFITKFVTILFSSSEQEINELLQALIDNITSFRSQFISDIFQTIICYQCDYIETQRFWYIWNIFQESIITISNDNTISATYKNEVIGSYLFVGRRYNIYKEKIKFIFEYTLFFEDIIQKCGNQSIVLSSILNLLYSVKITHLDRGLYWIINILSKDLNISIDTNTLFLLEEYTRIFVEEYKDKIKENLEVKKNIITITSFLTQHGSSIGSLLQNYI